MYKYGGKSREHSVQFRLTYKMLISRVCTYALDSFRILEIKRVPSIFEISRCQRLFYIFQQSSSCQRVS